MVAQRSHLQVRQPILRPRCTVRSRAVIRGRRRHYAQQHAGGNGGSGGSCGEHSPRSPQHSASPYAVGTAPLRRSQQPFARGCVRLRCPPSRREGCGGRQAPLCDGKHAAVNPRGRATAPHLASREAPRCRGTMSSTPLPQWGFFWTPSLSYRGWPARFVEQRTRVRNSYAEQWTAYRPRSHGRADSTWPASGRTAAEGMGPIPGAPSGQPRRRRGTRTWCEVLPVDALVGLPAPLRRWSVRTRGTGRSRLLPPVRASRPRAMALETEERRRSTGKLSRPHSGHVFH